MSKEQPKIFIGSSIEGLPVAYGVQENLEHDALCQVWDQGIFELTGNALDNLLEATKKYDFAIFIFQPDDIAKIRNEEYKVVRDNIIFELGLFISKLGKHKVFFLVPRGEKSLHLPSDLLGIAPGHYTPATDEKELLGALGPFCNKVRRQIKANWIVPVTTEKDQSKEESIDSEKHKDITAVETQEQSEVDDEGVSKDNFGNFTISEAPTVFFHHRICKAFPGSRGLSWFREPKEALDRLEILLHTPLLFENKRGYGTTCDPIWWFRGHQAMYVKEFERINDTRCLLNYNELEIDRIAVYRPTSAYWQSFVYIETKADTPVGIYSLTEEDIERMKGIFGYAWEEYGLFEGTPIDRECYDDGAAVIDGKVTDTFGAKLRIRYLSKYNFLITPIFSPVNTKEFERYSKDIINNILENHASLDDIITFIKALPRHNKDD